MGKLVVWSWVGVLIVTLIGMQAALFGTRGLPPAMQKWFGGAPAPIRKHVETPRVDAKESDQPPAKSEPLAGAKMVQPESLEQGFIVMVTDKTRIANASSPIFMPSSHNGWNPGDPKMQLQAQSDQKWRIVWEKPTLDSRIAFKFARGAWEKVECDKDFKDVDNRMLPMVDVTTFKPGEKPVIELEIVAWHDQAPGASGSDPSDRYRSIKVGAGTLARLEVVGGGGSARTLNRDLCVWLPPGYEEPENRTKTYPVLYLMDGQNLFDKHSGIPAEWGVDETCAALIKAGKIEPMIVVGVPNAGAKRAEEYSPIAIVDNVAPAGSEFIAFLTGEAMPRVQRAFRVKTGPENTGIGGSSLGAVIAMEAATEHPEVFGKVICESMPMTTHERAVFKHFAAKKSWPRQIAMGMGGKEFGTDEKSEPQNRQLSATAAAFKELMAGKGLASDRFRLTVEEGAPHDETAWAKRLGGELEFLFPAKK